MHTISIQLQFCFSSYSLSLSFSPPLWQRLRCVSCFAYFFFAYDLFSAILFLWNIPFDDTLSLKEISIIFWFTLSRSLIFASFKLQIFDMHNFPLCVYIICYGNRKHTRSKVNVVNEIAKRRNKKNAKTSKMFIFFSGSVFSICCFY